MSRSRATRLLVAGRSTAVAASVIIAAAPGTGAAPDVKGPKPVEVQLHAARDFQFGVTTTGASRQVRVINLSRTL